MLHSRVGNHADGGFDGSALLAEQAKLLSESTPSDINFIYFLKLRLSSQQRATSQRNYWQRVQQEELCSNHSSTAYARQRSGTAPTRLPAKEANGRFTTAEWNADSAHALSGGGPYMWRPSGNVENEAAAIYEAEAAAMEHSTASYGNLSRSGGLDKGVLRSSALEPSSTHLHYQRQVSGSLARPFHRETSFAGYNGSAASPSAIMLSDEDEPSQQRTSRPMPEEPMPNMGMSSRQYSRMTTSTADDRPAIASGKPQVPAGVDEMKDVPLEPCPHCGRTFAAGPLARHVVTCERHQETGPKVKFDARNAKPISSRTRGDGSTLGTSSVSSLAGEDRRRSLEAVAKTARWRRQSAQLRSSVAGVSSPVADDRVSCPSCGRFFSEDTAARHIPYCQMKGQRTM